MRKIILLILFIGFLGSFFLLAPKSVAACPAGYDGAGETIAGRPICCRAPLFDGSCLFPSTLWAGGRCCHTLALRIGNGAGFFTETWLHVEDRTVTVGDPISGRVQISTRSNIETPCIIFGDGETMPLSPCDGSAFADLKFFPRICTHSFEHTYKQAGRFTIIASIHGCDAQDPGIFGKSALIQVFEPEPPLPAPDPEKRWNPLGGATIQEIIVFIANAIFYIMSSLAVLFIMFGGFHIITAGGNPEQVSKGRKIILYTIIGFIVMALSRGAIELVLLVLGVNN